MPFDTLLAIGTIALQIGIVAIVIAWVTKAPFISWIAVRSSFLLSVVFIGAVLGSLVYSEYYRFPPCILCWYQRIFIFSIAIISLTGSLRKSALLRLQVLILSSIGLAIALFHRFIELFPGSGVSVCGTDGVACDTLYVFEFGYITIPMMSVTVLLFGVILSLVASRFPQQEVVSPLK